MPGTVVYLCGCRDQTADCLAESAGRIGIQFNAVEMGWSACDALPRLDEIRTHARDRIPAGAISGLLAGDRVSAICAAYIAEQQGLAFHSVEAMETCAQRLLARECLKASGLQVAGAFLVSSAASFEDAIHRTGFPCVLKPVRFTGGQGVMRADGPDEFREVFNKLRAIAGEGANEYFLVEEYVGGEEFAFYGFSVSGHLHPLALFDKPSGKTGPTFQDSILTAPSRHPRNVTVELMHTAGLAASSMRLDNGPVSIEMRWDGRCAIVLEVNPFLPPLPVCWALSPKGRNAVGEAMLLASAGVEPPVLQFHHAAGVGYLPLPRPGIFEGLDGVDEAIGADGADEVVACLEAGQMGCPPPEGSHRAAFITARGDSAEEVETRLRRALSALSVRTSPALTAGAAS